LLLALYVAKLGLVRYPKSKLKVEVLKKASLKLDAPKLKLNLDLVLVIFELVTYEFRVIVVPYDVIPTVKLLEQLQYVVFEV